MISYSPSAARALQRLQEQLPRLGVEVNREKTKGVDIIRGETFAFLGFEFRRVRKRTGDGHFILLTPRKKARLALKARVRELLQQGGGNPAQGVDRVSQHRAHWVGAVLSCGQRESRV